MNYKTLTILFVSILIVLLLPEVSLAATYWIDVNGTQTNLSNCEGSLPRSGLTACAPTVDLGSEKVVAGDTVYFRGGTYYLNKSGIKPKNSGTSTSNMITYSSYNNETVIFIGDGVCLGWNNSIDLTSGQKYIKVHGIIFKKFSGHLRMKGAAYNEISHCQFIGPPCESGFDYAGSIVQDGSHHNWIHNCVFSGWGAPCRPCPDTPAEHGTNLQIGWDMGDEGDDYNILENCILYHGGHDVLGVHGKYNIIRNNYVHNEPWMNYQGGKWSQRNIYTIGKSLAQHNIFEANKVGYAGYPQTITNCANEGIMDEGNYNIYRYNILFHNSGNGYSRAIKPVTGLANGSVIYNNVFWHNGYDPYTPQNKTGCWHNGYDHAISTCDNDTTCKDNAYINNLFYQNKNSINSSIEISKYSPVIEPTYQIIRNNWIGSINGDPKFVNISGTPDPMQKDQFNFNLQANSRAIDGGSYLTRTTNSGFNSTFLTVENTNFFQDGFGLQFVWFKANINADWIAIGSVNNVVQIKSIDYSTNTITLSSPMTWQDGDRIWLYKKSDGQRVLYGSAPDYGAYEYVQAAEPPDTTPPAAPRNVVVI